MLNIPFPHCTFYFLPFYLFGGRRALCVGEWAVPCGSSSSLENRSSRETTRRIRKLIWRVSGPNKRTLITPAPNCRGTLLASQEGCEAMQWLKLFKSWAPWHLWGCILNKVTIPFPEFLNLDSWTYMPKREANFYVLKMMGYFFHTCVSTSNSMS